MNYKILLTSFRVWLSHHTSNASDDLLEEIQAIKIPFTSLSFLRQLPVDISQASQLVISAIEKLYPNAVICCGMSEKRSILTVEACATRGDNLLKTGVDLERLVVNCESLEISYDAGKFVCEGLYYEILKYLAEHHPSTNCIFVHVPPLTDDNLPTVVEDFLHIIETMIMGVEP